MSGKFIFLAISLFMLQSCDTSKQRTLLKEFYLPGIAEKFEVYWLVETKKCSYFRCGESTSVVLAEYYEFASYRNGRRFSYPLLKCKEDAACFSSKRDFVFCGNVFLPIIPTDDLRLIGRDADRKNCDRSLVARGV